MPDTWTILKDNSTLLLGDAWEHLNNQQTGDTTVVAYCPFDVRVAENAFDITHEDLQLIIEIKKKGY